jgi:hypothetical protein
MPSTELRIAVENAMATYPPAKSMSPGTNRFRQQQIDLMLDYLPEFFSYADTSEITLLADSFLEWTSSTIRMDQRHEPGRCVIADVLLARLAPEVSKRESKPESAEDESEGASESSPLREHLLGVLEQRMKHFYERAFLSELWLLLDVLSYSETTRDSGPGREDDCPLARMMQSRFE